MLEDLKKQILQSPKDAGVYRFLGLDDKVLYVGKAKNLRNRLKSYLDNNRHNSRIRKMVSLAVKIETTITKTEDEALLLECNLIKKLMPRYNILLRDDKTFANILVDVSHSFPSISRHRGKKNIGGKYFGPFANGGAVYETIDYLKKSFLLRSCSDNEFKNHQKTGRPCMEYQIKRCSAPCVDLIDKKDYGQLIKEVLDFLGGKKANLQEDLAKKMQAYSGDLEFEKAQILRDRIRALSNIQAKQNIHLQSDANIDFVALVKQGLWACVVVSFFRNGNNYGFKPYFLNVGEDDLVEEIMEAFLGQFYADQEMPDLVLVGGFSEHKVGVANPDWHRSGLIGKIQTPKQGYKFNLLQDYLKLAKQELEKKLTSQIKDLEMLVELKKLFDLPKIPERIEVYDNSHTGGQFVVGGFIVSGREGFIKNAYRKFSIRLDELDHKDDCGFLRQVLMRRFKKTNENAPKSFKNNKNPFGHIGGRSECFVNNIFPDLIIIDGGKGQLNAANQVFKELGVDVAFVAMSKGENRNAGEEWFHQIDKPSFTLEKNLPIMFYLQRLRDEAHRFAIGFSRAKRAKAVTKSELDEIPNIGSKRKMLLLNHFGSFSAIHQAGLEDLMLVKGISKNMAVKIMDYFSK
jgi:excinuclease ABC subunit C